jgi:hypothetical protein
MEFMCRLSTKPTINRKWAEIIAKIEKTVQGDDSLAFQDIRNTTTFVYLPTTGKECKAYLKEAVGDLDGDELFADPETKEWWTQPSNGQMPEYGQSPLYTYLEELRDDPDKPVPETLVGLLQKHFRRPFVDIYMDLPLDPDCGPKGVSGGDHTVGNESLADVLEEVIGDVDKAQAYSICSAQTGKLLYGVPWKGRE